MRKLLLVPLLALGLAAAAPAGADDFTATITPSGFPPLISIQNGDRVVWKNGDTVNRQLVADDSSWKSPVIKPGGTWSHTFVNGGTFRYHGAVKPTQHGAIEVASTRAVQIQRGASTITFSHSLLLKGSVSKPSSSDEEVVIQAEPYGASSFDTVARITTDNGFWQARVQPSRTTVYRAIWKNVPSTGRTVFVYTWVWFLLLGGFIQAVQMNLKSSGWSTDAVHGHGYYDVETGAFRVPLYLSTVFEHPDRRTGEARKSAPFAMSCGVPALPNGTPA